MTIREAINKFRERQKFFQAHVLNNPKFKWYQRGMWLISLSWASALAVQSVPFYGAIGAGESAYKAGDYITAEAKFKEALIESNKFSQGDLRRAKIYNNLAELYRTIYRFDLAEPYYEKAVAIARQLSASRPELPMSLQNQATLLRDEGRYAESEVKFREALSLWDKNIKRTDDANRAAILNGIGKVLRDQGNYSDAEKFYKKALAIKEKLLGENDADNSVVLANLGGVYRDLGNYAESEKFYLRAMQIDRVAFGTAHSHTATDMNNLANVYRDQGKLDEAEVLCRRALEIRTRLYNPNHPLIAKSLIGLGEIAQQKHDLKAAEELYQRAANMQKKSLGPTHPDLAATYNLLGNNLLAQGKIFEARKLQNSCLEIREARLSESHPDIGVALIDRARTERARELANAFKRDAERGTRILEQSLGSAHPVTKRTLAALHSQAPSAYAD